MEEAEFGARCRTCSGSYSPIPGRGCFGYLPGDRIVVSLPSPVVELLPRYFQRSSIYCKVLFHAESHSLEAALGILAYINGTSDFGITYQRGTLASISLEVFADADYASKAMDGRSVSGGAIICEEACVCRFSRTQKCFPLSASEAEYVALGDAVKELFLRQVWRFMPPGKGMPRFPMFEENQGAVHLSQNPVSNSNSKHVDVRHHLLRELVLQRGIFGSHVPSEYQRADILTKALAFDVFAIHRRFLMNLSVSRVCLPLRWIDDLICVY